MSSLKMALDTVWRKMQNQQSHQHYIFIENLSFRVCVCVFVRARARVWDVNNRTNPSVPDCKMYSRALYLEYHQIWSSCKKIVLLLFYSTLLIAWEIFDTNDASRISSTPFFRIIGYLYIARHVILVFGTFTFCTTHIKIASSVRRTERERLHEFLWN
jgi:hypothetical protein